MLKQGKGNNMKQSNLVFRNLDINSAWNPTLGNSWPAFIGQVPSSARLCHFFLGGGWAAMRTGRNSFWGPVSSGKETSTVYFNTGRC